MSDSLDNLSQKQKIALALGAASSLALALLGYLYYRSASKEKPTQDEGKTESTETQTEVQTEVQTDSQQQQQQAKREFDPKEEENYIRATALKEEGNRAFKASEFDKAIQLYTESLKLIPRDAHFLYSNRSAAYLAAQNTQAAVADAKEAIRLAPNWSKGYFRLGKALFNQRDLNEAYMSLKKGLSLETTSDEIKNVIKKVASELPPGDLDSRHIVENNLMKMYFLKNAQSIAQTISLDFNAVVQSVKNKKFESVDEILDLPTVKDAFQADPVATLRVLISIFLCEIEDIASAKKLTQKALSIKEEPDVLVQNLYLLSKQQDKIEESLVAARKAIKYNPNDMLAANLFAAVILRLHMKYPPPIPQPGQFPLPDNFPAPIFELLNDFDQALHAPGVTKVVIAECGIQTWLRLFNDPQISLRLQKEEQENQRNNTPTNQAFLKGLQSGTFAQLCLNPFFLSALSEVVLNNVFMEKVLGPFREALATLKPGPEFLQLKHLIFAIGLQSWRTSYVWDFTNSDDRNNYEVIRKKLVNMLRAHNEEPSDPSEPSDQIDEKIFHYIALVAMYEPLSKIEGIFPLLSKIDLTKQDPLFAKLVKMTLLDHYAEAEIKKALVPLTPIPNTPQVKMYNAGAFPIWDSLPHTLTRLPIRAEMEWVFPDYQLDGFEGSSVSKVLVVGCGSGVEPLQLATVYENIEITAIDISETNLAYAIRNTKELHLDNAIKYHLADVMALKPSHLPQNFDLVMAYGVLHHLPDLYKGWERLVTFLRPGGLMKVGLFPKRWLDMIASARKVLLKYPDFSDLFEVRPNSPLPEVIRQPTIEQLRKARSLIMESQEEDLQDLMGTPFFYNLNEFADTLFNPKIWAISFKNIGQCLERLKLKLVGFEFPGISQETILNYRFEHPDDPNMLNFDYLDTFQEQHPHALFVFSHQVVFTCEKPRN